MMVTIALDFVIFLGAAVVTYMVGWTIIDTRRDRNRYRRTAAHRNYRAALGASSLAQPSSAPVGASAPLPGEIAAGIATDPRAGDGPGLASQPHPPPSETASLDPDAKAPDGIEPVTGWRCWGYNSGYLTSVNDALIWPAKEAYVAECMKGIGTTHEEHLSPAENCTCGLYAAGAENACQWTQRKGQPVVWGIVSGWGKVIEHNRGWKAQYAYPKLLFVWDEDTKKAAKAALLLKQRYGCEVQVATDEQATNAGVPGRVARYIHTTSGVNSSGQIQQWQARVAAHSAATQAVLQNPQSWTNNTQISGNTAPQPAQNPSFQTFASGAAYQEFVAAEAKKALESAALARSRKAAQALLQLGMVLPESVGHELGFDDEFPSTPAEAAQDQPIQNQPMTAQQLREWMDV